ncbi:MAG: maleylpyruvate isomerase family mycothiol-dependent enzyme [Nocardiaceae bacterium]|nr:maleylpyruvate isomerase family mycothiol-dependent enzyme [Nocardiaceae bacterium]
MPTLPDSATALRDATHRFIAMVQDVDETQLSEMVPATPEWTVRQAIAHVALGAAYYANCLAGRDQWVNSPTQTAEKNTALLEIRRGVPVPTALADMARAVDEVIDLLAALGDEPVGFHARQLLTPQGIQSMLVNEVLVHGHDIAQALRRPWKIPDEEAMLALQAMTALCAAWLDPVKSAGHTASYRIRLRG